LTKRKKKKEKAGGKCKTPSTGAGEGSIQPGRGGKKPMPETATGTANSKDSGQTKLMTGTANVLPSQVQPRPQKKRGGGSESVVPVHKRGVEKQKTARNGGRGLWFGNRHCPPETHCRPCKGHGRHRKKIKTHCREKGYKIKPSKTFLNQKKKSPSRNEKTKKLSRVETCR